MKKKILITGGAGFGGSGLVRRLLPEEFVVTVVDTVGPNQADLLRDVIHHKNLTYKWKSIHDIRKSDIDGHDIVIHFAAEANVPVGFESPNWTVYENVNGTVSLLEACKGTNLEKVVYAGSGNEWGRPIYLPIDEDHPLTPHNPYAFSKAAAELAFWAWHRAYRIPIVVMSNGIVSGPNMRKDIFIYKWLKNIILGKPVILEGCNQTRDLTYVDDVIDAWIRVIKAPAKSVINQKFQVSYGVEYKISDILEICFDVARRRVKVIKKPYRPGEREQRECFDNTKARRLLGYTPKVDPKKNVELTLNWMKSLDKKDL